jgi:hypothetical protein
VSTGVPPGAVRTSLYPGRARFQRAVLINCLADPVREVKELLGTFGPKSKE